MGLKIVRYKKDGDLRWGVLSGEQILDVENDSGTLAEFLKEGVDQARATLDEPPSDTVDLKEAVLASPVTRPANIVCQGANYSSHRQESGMTADRPEFNLIFGKADSALCSHDSDVIRPAGVKLLDYEIELGLIIGNDISGPVDVTNENLHHHVAGLVIMNDISARDVQLPEGQWLRGKSYRTFAPAGPFLYILDEDEYPKIHDLELNLWVNDELRQSANTNQLLFKPEETLTELSRVMDFSPGDVLLTGTPGGVAMNLSKADLEAATKITSPLSGKVEGFLDAQTDNTDYLKDGDVIRASIKSTDASIDLGEQKNKVVAQK
ncbi:fumarylacetoacetate hydrolase family protein [Lacicoccus alkaliphilus]|uniref:2-keto-4-pentenoate hydratase/2-oxohepta-3-ene-1,7-dioic acid hydratase (Catechol pathway) n=1 Tax=Lacicoccus alkaliphilus DSM 16010 TaxID=1123231 RepID=A0A1M7HQ68_9BACL|nr:fumarylacetoacetate hydrolase family protein [Salinicoccus alkaliphilus]SHM30559.1 2-keto-4-pentenoate hydratase/2-oxohepta-3-ene-1,7-dioic acid hydratase (catechol pathway) [Salinicoccus alkaliphilus DSM 16010]